MNRNLMICVSIIAFLAAGSALLAAEQMPVRDKIVVATDGSGDFKTVQAAVDAVPDGAAMWTEIFIKNGTYDGLVKIPREKGKIILRGEDREKTILQSSTFHAAVSSRGKKYNAADRTVQNFADDVILTRMTVRNLTWKKNPKAGAAWDMAVQNLGDRFIVHDVTMLGRHNTFDTRARGGSRFYVSECLIEGQAHFLAIFDNDGVFEDTTLRYSSVTGSPHASSIFKRGDPRQSLAERTKLVIRNCTLTIPRDQRNTLKATINTWDYGAVVYYIGNTFEKGCRWGRFAGNSRRGNGKIWGFIHGNKNMPPLGDEGLKNPDGGPMIQQITKEEADKMTAEKFLAGDDKWNPKKLIAQLLKLSGNSVTTRVLPRELDRE